MAITNREARKLILDKTDGHCAYCTDELGDSWHVDHYHPQSRGGLDLLDNLVAACGTCNIRKHAAIPMIESLETHLEFFYRRHSIRAEIANFLGCDYSQVCMSSKHLDMVYSAVDCHGMEAVESWIREISKYGVMWEWIGPMINNRCEHEFRVQIAASRSAD